MTLEVTNEASLTRPDLSNRDFALDIQDFKVYYDTPRGIVKAVDGISLAIRQGERFALVGESGSGKSTLAMAVMRLTRPPGRIVGGSVFLHGTDLVSISEEEMRQTRLADIALVPQGAMNSLNPVMKIGNQVIDGIIDHMPEDAPKPDADELENRVNGLLVRVGLAPMVGQLYPHELSGGMAQRVVMAIALICSPRFIISDDATSGLDVTVQTQVLELLQDLVQQQGASMLFITRDIGITAHYCHQVAIIYAGEIVEIAETESFFDNPQHPYSVMLLSAFSHNPKLRGMWSKTEEIVHGAETGRGCLFAGRCVRASDTCLKEHPKMRGMGPRHSVRCHHPVER